MSETRWQSLRTTCSAESRPLSRSRWSTLTFSSRQSVRPSATRWRADVREYGVIHRGFWANEAIKEAGDDARTLAVYLLTSPHTTTLGAFRIPDAYACDDLGWDSQRLRNGFETLSSIGFVRYDSATKWVWVVKFLE